MIALLAAMALFDAHLKSSLTEGYCPTGPRWIIASGNFGLFWKGIVRSDVMSQVRREAGRPFKEFELAVHRATGIRPTPLRWRIWMGNRFLAAGAEEGVGFCVRPGLLLRGVHLIRRFVFGARAEHGIYQFDQFFYAWRKGFLVVAASPEYVAATLAAAQPPLEPSQAPDEIRIHWLGKRQALLRVRGAEGIPVEGWLHAAVHRRSQPLTLADPWPETPLFSIAVSKWEDFQTLYTVLDEMVHGNRSWGFLTAFGETAWTRWGFGALPAGWERAVDQCAFALLNVDTSEVLPIPEAALVLRAKRITRTPHPLRPLIPAIDAVPAEWQGQAGLIAPLLGEKLALCLARAGPDWFAASQEPVMARLLGMLRDSDEIDADLALRMDWRKLGAALEKLARQAHAMELIPSHGTHSLSEKLLPLARAGAGLGTLQVNGCMEGDRLYFDGFLALQGRRLQEAS